MKPIFSPAGVAAAILGHALLLQAGDYGEKYEDYPVDAGYKHASPQALDAWRDRKYGMRIIWGVYSMLDAEASWPLTGSSGQFRDKYQNLYKQFNPTDFSGEAWAELMIRCGFKYFTFTTKHHDGFAMWDTKTKVPKRFIQSGPKAGQIEDCDLHYDIMETPFHRDILRELIDASSQRGISTGLYFSHADWYDADFRLDRWNPHRDTNYSRQTDPEGWKRLVARHREQVRELLTRYGKVDQFEWDLCFPESAWPDVVETVKMARALQPDVLMRDRGIGQYGDIMTPEMWFPQTNPSQQQAKGQGQIVDKPWQVIYNVAGQAAYDPNPQHYKSAEWILSSLIDTVAKGGNFMPMLGADAKGNFHPVAVERLERVGRWLAVNGEAIYKTRPYRTWKDGDAIRYTRSKDRRNVYAMSLQWPGRQLKLREVRALEGSQIRMLGFHDPLAWHQDPDGLSIEIPDRLEDEHQRPCEMAWAFKVEVPPADAAAVAQEPMAHEVAPSAVGGYAAGLQYRYYEGDWEGLPEAIVSMPFKVGINRRFDLSVADRKIGYVIDYSGSLRIDRDGEYVFYVTSQSGSRLEIAGKTAADHEGGNIRSGSRGPHEVRSAMVLKEGLHAVRLIFYTDRFNPEPVLRVEYEGPGIARQVVPAEVLYHPAPATGAPQAAAPAPHQGPGAMLNLTLQKQTLSKDAKGMFYWKAVRTPVQWRADETMLVIIDMWNKHWCLDGVQGVRAMMPWFNDVVKHARSLGVQIIHSPTAPAMEPYYSHPAYQYMSTFPLATLPATLPHEEFPMPLNVADGGANGPILDVGYEAKGYAEVEGLDIVFEPNGAKDGICESLQLAWNLMQARGIRHVIVTGTAANMCVMGKPLGIRNLVEHGIDVVLARDMTRPMYSPASPPFVNMTEATKMMTDYYEKFWCPTITGKEVLESHLRANE